MRFRSRRNYREGTSDGLLSFYAPLTIDRSRAFKLREEICQGKLEDKAVDWKLIFLLSLFGLVMAIATVFIVPSNVEPIFWLVTFIVCAIIIARVRSTAFFVHGLLVGIMNSIWVTGAHIVFFDRYIASHPKEAGMMASMPLPSSPRLMMALVGPVIGIASGAIIGLFAYIARGLMPKQTMKV
jgi:hypothetical protein